MRWRIAIGICYVGSRGASPVWRVLKSDRCNAVKFQAAGGASWAHFADALRDFSSGVGAAQASNSFDDSWARPIGLFGTVENLTHLTECLKYFFDLHYRSSDCRIYGKGN
jgi:hypothetical protein